MKKIIAKYLTYLIYFFGIFLILKFGFYDSIINCDYSIIHSIVLPFLIFFKLILILFILIMLLTVNSFLFTNTFKKHEK